jgi:phosphoribosylcarboxyaminoimidazole (NCAIR) mutase
MTSLPRPDDVLFAVADVGARVVTIREALEAGYVGAALTAARLLTTEAEELVERLSRQVAAEAGFEHVSALVEAERDRLGGDAA